MKQVVLCFIALVIAGGVGLFAINYIETSRAASTAPKPMIASDVGADPNTFQVLNRDYAKDATHVYYLRNILQGADSTSFMTLDSVYAKDSSHVYYHGRVIADADAATFARLNWEFGKDKNAGFFNGFRIPGSDGATIKSKGFFCCSAEDKNHTYSTQSATGDLKIDGEVSEEWEEFFRNFYK